MQAFYDKNEFECVYIVFKFKTVFVFLYAICKHKNNKHKYIYRFFFSLFIKTNFWNNTLI